MVKYTYIISYIQSAENIGSEYREMSDVVKFGKIFWEIHNYMSKCFFQFSSFRKKFKKQSV